MVDSSRLPPLSITRLGERCDSHVQDRPIPFALAPVSSTRLGVFREVVGLVDVVVGLDEAVDWDNIGPHPRLAELEERCRCGAPRGEHLVTGDQRAETWPCNGWKASSVASKAGAK